MLHLTDTISDLTSAIGVCNTHIIDYHSILSKMSSIFFNDTV